MSAPCFECGGAADHHHHVVPRLFGGTKTVPLCDGCHARAHGHHGWRGHRELTRAALQAKRARGERAGALPYGFSANADGKLIQDATERTVIAKVRELRAAGLSLRAIVSKLAQDGVVSRSSKPLSLTQVQRILATASEDAR